MAWIYVCYKNHLGLIPTSLTIKINIHVHSLFRTLKHPKQVKENSNRRLRIEIQEFETLMV